MKLRALALALGLGLLGPGVALADADEAPTRSDPLAAYFTALEATKLVDVESGNLDSLKVELHAGEALLKSGSYVNAAVALYAIVKSPRYDAFKTFVEFQNAEYDLAVALAKAGSYGAALDEIEDILARGPAATYWGPAHRRAVDIALETRDHAGVLARLEAVKGDGTIPVSAAGERAYLRGRAAYESGQLAAAEGQLVTISKQSRMYSSALYLRGVIRARRGEYQESAEALCEVAGTPDSDRLTFVVDDRYFTVKDLARLGLGRLAHEQGEYDDAYYHYFQIPDDSVYLPDALFEASWSMYQKRELATARDLVHELLKQFPTAPTWPEASLLAGYVDLADCKFDDSQHWYDALAAKLQPIVDTIDRARHDATLRDELFAKAITRYREVKHSGEIDGKTAGTQVAESPTDQVLALLRLDPEFIRLNDAIVGVTELANSAPAVTRQWQTLGHQLSQQHVAAVSAAPTMEQEQLADANALVEDVRRLEVQVDAGRAELARGRRDGTLSPEDAAAEDKRLAALADKVVALREHAIAAADAAASQVTTDAAPGIKPMITSDVAEARRLDKQAHVIAADLRARGDKLAQLAIEKLYVDTRRVLDKAKLGKIDAIIGQKRKLDIEVQDLAAGRFPAELVGRMWNASLIGDDEEYWPWQGEYWKDEYEGFR